jgi:two-component system sensor histidine kinase YesM
MILGVFSILITQHFIRVNVEKNNLNMLNQSKESIEIMLKDLDSLSLGFGSDPVITKRLKEILAADVYSMDMFDSLDYIKNYIDVPVNSKLYIHSIYVYFKNSRNRFISS